MMTAGLKKLIFLIAALMPVFFAASCSLGFKAPTDLIKKPKLGVNESMAIEVIEEVITPGGESVRPLKPGDISAVGYIDWDDDRIPEVNTFYKNEQKRKVGLIILQKQGEIWKLVENVELTGGDIAYAKFVDINQDGILDLLMANEASEGAYSIINLFISDDGGYRNIWTEAFTDLVVDDIDGDGKTEIFVVKLDRNVHSSIAAYAYNDGEIQLLDELELDRYISGYYNITAEKIDEKERAVILDFTLGSKSASNVIRFYEGSLHAGIEPLGNAEDYSESSKNNQVKSRDVNGDGIVEIARSYNPKFYEDDERGVDIYLWREFSSAEGDFKYIDKCMSYVNLGHYFEFLFPERWFEAMKEGRLTVVKSSPGHKRNYISFYMLGENDAMVLLLTLEVFSKEDYDIWRNNKANEIYNVVALSSKYESELIAYYPSDEKRVRANDYAAFKKLMLSDAEIKDAYRNLN